ncbi:MAG TPA: fructose-6-phosphate aldolase [Bryobacteraceae bacterium]|jgi:transaldolase|nr:fructose-6-phosphate aldolase [Bryobacteraceae bacterium]
MKFFLDTANLEELKSGARWGIIDGVTTNPSLIAKEGVALEEQIRRICEIIDGDISAEVVAVKADEMLEQGRRLARIHKNVVVKVPLTRDGIRACSILSQEGIRVNVTLCFSAGQALLAAKAGAYFVSPFVGRLDDIGANGMDLIREIVQIYRNYGFNTQVLAASLRNTTHVIEAAKAGAHVGTLPYKVVDALFDHPLTDKGLDQFMKDYARAFQTTSAAI